MPTRERVQELITAVIAGDHADAIARFYTDDASMQENAAEPRRGLQNLVDRERKVTEKVAEIVTHPPDLVVIDGDRVAIHWVFEFTHQDGRIRIVDEVAVQVWEGDRIARERFFYDFALGGVARAYLSPARRRGAHCEPIRAGYTGTP